MRFGKQRQLELTDILLRLFTDMLLEAKKTGDVESIADESRWLKKVFELNLTNDPKQLFLLGALAQKVHDGAPQAFSKTMENFKK